MGNQFSQHRRLKQGGQNSVTSSRVLLRQEFGSLNVSLSKPFLPPAKLISLHSTSPRAVATSQNLVNSCLALSFPGMCGLQAGLLPDEILPGCYLCLHQTLAPSNFTQNSRALQDYRVLHKLFINQEFLKLLCSDRPKILHCETFDRQPLMKTSLSGIIFVALRSFHCNCRSARTPILCNGVLPFPE